MGAEAVKTTPSGAPAPDADGPAESAGIHHPIALGDHHLAAVRETPRRAPTRLEQGAPVCVAGHLPRRLTRADAGRPRAGIQKRDDGRFELLVRAVAAPRPTRARAVAERLRGTAPKPAAHDGPAAASTNSRAPWAGPTGFRGRFGALRFAHDGLTLDDRYREEARGYPRYDAVSNRSRDSIVDFESTARRRRERRRALAPATSAGMYRL